MKLSRSEIVEGLKARASQIVSRGHKMRSWKFFNIGKANAEIGRLEKELGLPEGERGWKIADANGQIKELEALVAERDGTSQIQQPIVTTDSDEFADVVSAMGARSGSEQRNTAVKESIKNSELLRPFLGKQGMKALLEANGGAGLVGARANEVFKAELKKRGITPWTEDGKVEIQPPAAAAPNLFAGKSDAEILSLSKLPHDATVTALLAEEIKTRMATLDSVLVNACLSMGIESKGMNTIQMVEAMTASNIRTLSKLGIRMSDIPDRRAARVATEGLTGLARMAGAIKIEVMQSAPKTHYPEPEATGLSKMAKAIKIQK